MLNRMVIQAVLGHPLTVYGTGGQIRGLINIVDTVECIRLSCRAPGRAGRVPGLQPVHRVDVGLEIAETVARMYPGHCEIESVDNPRVEAESHYYRAAHTRLLDLGLVPHLLSEALIGSMFAIVERNKSRADIEAIRPTVRWRATGSPLRSRTFSAATS